MTDTEQSHFMPCINENCRVFHLVEVSDLKSNEQMLCESCRKKMKKSHTVQCLNCKAILDFIPLIANEPPSNLYVEKCTLCGGTFDDEIRLITNPSRELYI